MVGTREMQKWVPQTVTPIHPATRLWEHVNRFFSLIFRKKLFGETGIIKTTPSQWVPPCWNNKKYNFSLARSLFCGYDKNKIHNLSFYFYFKNFWALFFPIVGRAGGRCRTEIILKLAVFSIAMLPYGPTT